jgi:hypothetical protein
LDGLKIVTVVTSARRAAGHRNNANIVIAQRFTPGRTNSLAEYCGTFPVAKIGPAVAASAADGARRERR